MYISHQHKFLYFVSPKCGSSTVRNALRPFADQGAYLEHFYNPEYEQIIGFEEHTGVDEFLRCKGASSIYKKYFKFSFVRNPYDRIYSAFEQDKYAAKNFPEWRSIKKPILEAVDYDFNVYIKNMLINADIVNDWRWVNFSPLINYTNQGNKIVLDWVGKTETLENDLVQLSNILGVDIGPILNKNVRNQQSGTNLKYTDNYSMESISIVNKLYKNDFLLFNYEMFDC